MELPRRAAFTVLVVDDDPDAAESLAVVLGLYGFECRFALSAEEALAAAADDPPDAVVADVVMPGMDGLTMIRRLRAERGQELFVVVVSGRESAADRRRSAEAGADVHLAKPADPVALNELLRAARRKAARPRLSTALA